MRRTAVTLAVAVLISGAAACGSGDDDDAATNDAAAATTTTPETGDDPLTGTWRTEPQTCEQQQAAIDRAFTAEQQALARVECFPAAMTIRFEDGRLIIFMGEETGWDGDYEVVDDRTFKAGDMPGAGLYITYTYEIEGDELVIDMVEDDAPAPSEAELLGEQINQTFIYETAPFTRVG